VRTTLAFLLAALAFVAGCGSAGEQRLTKAQFEEHAQADGKALQKVITDIGKASSLSELATQVGAARQAVKAAADDLDSLEPPADAEKPTDTIVQALRGIDSQLQELEKAAKDKDLLAVQKTATAIQSSPDLKAARQAANELKQKGYKIGILGS